MTLCTGESKRGEVEIPLGKVLMWVSRRNFGINIIIGNRSMATFFFFFLGGGGRLGGAYVKKLLLIESMCHAPLVRARITDVQRK